MDARAWRWRRAMWLLGPALVVACTLLVALVVWTFFESVSPYNIPEGVPVWDRAVGMYLVVLIAFNYYAACFTKPGSYVDVLRARRAASRATPNMSTATTAGRKSLSPLSAGHSNPTTANFLIPPARRRTAAYSTSASSSASSDMDDATRSPGLSLDTTADIGPTINPIVTGTIPGTVSSAATITDGGSPATSIAMRGDHNMNTDSAVVSPHTGDRIPLVALRGNTDIATTSAATTAPFVRAVAADAVTLAGSTSSIPGVIQATGTTLRRTDQTIPPRAQDGFAADITSGSDGDDDSDVVRVMGDVTRRRSRRHEYISLRMPTNSHTTGDRDVTDDTKDRMELAPFVDLDVLVKCRRCLYPKPERSHHCSICNQCVMKQDHHCPWINGCVGHFNQRYFYLFMVYMSIGCVYYLSFAGSLFYHEAFRGEGKFVWRSTGAYSRFFFSFLLCAAMFFAITGMTIWHTYLIGTGQTIIEFYSNADLRHDQPLTGAGFFNEYDFGFVNNFRIFFNLYGGMSVFTILMPIRVPPVGDGITWLKCSDVLRGTGNGSVTTALVLASQGKAQWQRPHA